MTCAAPGWWPPDARACVDDIIAYRLVGASACADRITSALASVALESQRLGRDVAQDVEEAGRLFCGLKPDTALYRNVARSLTHAAAGGRAADVEAAAERLSDYRRSARSAVVSWTESLLEEADTLLVHDYSSTVVRIVESLGARRPRRIVVTAGEPLGQGPRVARLAADAGHRVTYTPDMSVARVSDRIDAFLVGVESFYPDGSLANTVGTVMLSLLCRESGVPVVAPAETLKCDMGRSGVLDAPLTARLLHPWPTDPRGRQNSWTIVPFVLDPVPASLVSTYVTEAGTCAPSEVGTLAQQTLRRAVGLPGA